MNKSSTNEFVPCPAGDPWITCRSKSHHRRIYYYNTITGEAIWNLTDFENDKCKKSTKVSIESRDQSDSYPEPREPPQDICRNIFISEANEQNINTDSTSTIFNECINNEPFTENSLSPNAKVQRYDNISAINDLMFSIPVAPTSTPNNSFSINQQQLKTDLDHNVMEIKNNYVHTTSVPLSKRFQIIKNVNNSFRFVIPEQEEKSEVPEVSEILDNTYSHNINDTLPNNYEHSVDANDLRQILSLKRQSHITNNIQQIDPNRTTISSNTNETLDISNFKFEEHQTDNVNEDHFMNTSETTDVENVNIKSEDCIYLVPDANVIQCHYSFLKFLLKFGETFHFLVLDNIVEHVRNNMRNIVPEKRRRARLSMIFISNNVRKGSISIVQNPIDRSKTGPFHVLECCLKLVEEHKKTILLSNHEHIKLHRNADRILILSVNELKSIVNTLGDANLIRDKLYPNDRQDLYTQYISSKQEPDVPDYINEEKLEKQIAPTKVSIGVETSFIGERNSTDASVQTDLDSELLTRILNTDSVKAILADSVKLKEMLNTDNNNSFLKSWDVNMCSPKLTTKDVDNDAKQRNFKWRRKRPRSIVEQKEVQISLDNNIMVHIPKRKICSDIDKQNNKCNVPEDNVPPTDGSSTSGIVSTAPSPNDYWSECENTRNISSVDKEIEKDNNNVMFEVTSQVMNDNLKSRSDEWVSRFVQIMEEALTQVLEKNPSESPNVIDPPWTLFEATTCIKMKYRKDCDIVDAGNKLINTLTKISDKKGTVNIHLTPKQYMEMYSYGVYLIDALQAAFEGCEDLQIASESLSKLLNDIQHPNLSTSQNDAFNIQDDSNREAKEKAFQNNGDDSSIHQKKQINLSTISSPSKRKLRSKFKNENNKVEERKNLVKNIEEAESKNSLLLDLKDCNDEKESLRSFVEDERHTPLYDPPTLHEVRTINTFTENTTPTSNNDSKQPKIIINFTQRADYEEKLKKQDLDSNDNDLEESYLDYNNDDDYTSDDEYDQYENNKEWSNNKHFGLDNIFNNMLLDIRQTFIIVFAFCMTCQKAINICDPDRKLLEAKEVYSKITNICNVLNRIIKRDDKLFVSHIAEVLKAEDVMEDFKFDVSDLTKYKEVITKYLEQANSLRECLETILKHMSR